MTAAVVGVFGFEFLFRKLIIGFGENRRGRRHVHPFLIPQR